MWLFGKRNDNNDVKAFKKMKKAMKSEEHKQNLHDIISMNMVSTSKQLLWVLITNAILWIWCSYILAFMGRDQIAEALSTNVCSVILGQIAAYFISKTIENVFKFNNIGGPATAITKGKSFFTKNRGDETNESNEQVAGIEGEFGVNSYQPASPSTAEQFNSECLD